MRKLLQIMTSLLLTLCLIGCSSKPKSAKTQLKEAFPDYGTSVLSLTDEESEIYLEYYKNNKDLSYNELEAEVFFYDENTPKKFKEIVDNLNTMSENATQDWDIRNFYKNEDGDATYDLYWNGKYSGYKIGFLKPTEDYRSSVSLFQTEALSMPSDEQVLPIVILVNCVDESLIAQYGTNIGTIISQTINNPTTLNNNTYYITTDGNGYLTLLVMLDSEDKIEESSSTSNTQSSNKFIAKGSTTLMPFLQNAESNGYAITSPNRNGNRVSAQVKSTNGQSTSGISIEYYVEDQKVYNVTVIASDSTTFNSDSFKSCTIAMAQSINPNISSSDASTMFENAKTSGQATVDHDMQFLVEPNSNECSMSY